MNIVKKISYIFIILYLSGCSNPNWYKPMGYIFNRMPKGGTPGFELGWIHGCQSGFGSNFGGKFMMAFYTWSRDPDISSVTPNIEVIKKRYKKELKDINWDDEDEIKRNFYDYNKIFWASHLFCRHSILGTLQTAKMQAPLQGEVRYNPMAHSVGSVWELRGKGDTRIGTGHW